MGTWNLRCALSKKPICDNTHTVLRVYLKRNPEDVEHFRKNIINGLLRLDADEQARDIVGFRVGKYDGYGMLKNENWSYFVDNYQHMDIKINEANKFINKLPESKELALPNLEFNDTKYSLAKLNSFIRFLAEDKGIWFKLTRTARYEPTRRRYSEVTTANDNKYNEGVFGPRCVLSGQNILPGDRVARLFLSEYANDSEILEESEYFLKSDSCYPHAYFAPFGFVMETIIDADGKHTLVDNASLIDKRVLDWVESNQTEHYYTMCMHWEAYTKLMALRKHMVTPYTASKNDIAQAKAHWETLNANADGKKFGFASALWAHNTIKHNYMSSWRKNFYDMLELVEFAEDPAFATKVSELADFYWLMYQQNEMFHPSIKIS